MDLAVTVRRDDDTAVALVLKGSLDLASRSHLAEAARTAFTPQTTTRVVDLEDVTFMDSTGLGVLIELAGDADDEGATFVVENPSRSVQRLLEISGLADRFTR